MNEIILCKKLYYSGSGGGGVLVVDTNHTVLIAVDVCVPVDAGVATKIWRHGQNQTCEIMSIKFITKLQRQRTSWPLLYYP